MSRQSSKVKLLAFDERHLDKSFEWRNDYDVFKWCRQYESLSKTQHESWFSSLKNNKSIKMYSVHSDEGFIGVCGLTSIDFINSRAEFSLYIGSNFQGSGYGTSALKALVDHGFKVLNLNCIWGETFANNPALKIFHKLGFKQDGVRRQFYYREGKYIDCNLVSILRSEWK